MDTKNYKFGKDKRGAKAIHADISDGDIQAVGIGNLRVFIVPDGRFWFAQGLEIDYAAQGYSIEDAKKNFEEGLAATIDLHLKVHGNIENLLEPAPREVLQEAVRELDSLQLYSQLSFHKVEPEWALPFTGIDYWVTKESPTKEAPPC